jgi:hypothetical protein
MSDLFAMRRANGDWFALDDHGAFGVPVFRSIGEAMLARTRHSGMECFRPVILDRAAFDNLTHSEDASFWLIDNPLVKLRRGRVMNQAQLLETMCAA